MICSGSLVECSFMLLCVGKRFPISRRLFVPLPAVCEYHRQIAFSEGTRPIHSLDCERILGK